MITEIALGIGLLASLGLHHLSTRIERLLGERIDIANRRIDTMNKRIEALPVALAGRVVQLIDERAKSTAPKGKHVVN
jgi:hypothetical protein